MRAELASKSLQWTSAFRDAAKFRNPLGEPEIPAVVRQPTIQAVLLPFNRVASKHAVMSGSKKRLAACLYFMLHAHEHLEKESIKLHPTYRHIFWVMRIERLKS